MTRSTALGLALLSSLLLSSGCRFADPELPPPLTEVLGGTPWQQAAEPTPQRFRLALAPIRIAYEPQRLYPMDPTKHGALPDLQALRRDLALGLRRLGVFEQVELRGERDSTPARVAAEAWSANDDLVLEVELTDYHQAYLGHSNYVWWFVSYVTYIWPAWFVPVDYYGGGIEAKVKLSSVQRNAPPLFERAFRVRPREVSRELTPSDRELAGFLDLGALFNVENSLEESNWQAVERWVGPHTRRQLILDVLRRLEQEVGTPLRSREASDREALLGKTRKRIALVVGASSFADSAMGSAPFAAEDARATAELWASPAGGGLEVGRELTLLVDEAATRTAVLGGVAAIASRAAAGDEVLIYFAGHGIGGAAGGGRVALFDTEASRLEETSLGLAEIQAALEAVRADRVLVVVDASFAGGAPGGRAIGSPAAPDLGLAPLAPGRIYLFASQPDQAARVLPEASAGLFSQLFRSGLGGVADVDEDGRVDLPELLGFLRDEVKSRAAIEGYAQWPSVLGDSESTQLAWPR